MALYKKGSKNRDKSLLHDYKGYILCKVTNENGVYEKNCWTICGTGIKVPSVQVAKEVVDLAVEKGIDKASLISALFDTNGSSIFTEIDYLP